MIKLGDTVRDAITGFEGVATSRVEYINGCVQYGVQPKVDKDGKLPDSMYVDQQRLVVLTREAPYIPQPQAVGGPQRDAPGGSYCG